MCFEFCLVTHVLGRMEVGWTDWGRAPGEENSTGDGTCLKVPSKYEPVVPGTRSPREEGLHLPAVVLGGWFGSSANFSHWTWGGQAMMGSLRESTLPSKAGTSGRAGRLRGWGPECSDTRLPRRRLLLVCLQIIPLSRGPVSAIRLHGWPVTAQPCTWQSPGAQCHLQVPLDTGEGGQTVCSQAQPAGSSSGATGRRWVPQGVGKG